jgi:formylglycine-generating enzyme required for sulfatase activity
MASVPAGTYVSLYALHGAPTALRGFRLDVYPVTREDYAKFVAEHPEWRKSRSSARGYLADWLSDTRFGREADRTRPVTQVTRAAARAYCAAQGKRLPTENEWEYVAAASANRKDGTNDPSFRQKLIDIYTRRHEPAPRIGTGFRNAFGVNDMHGVVWEWVESHDHHAMQMATSARHDLSCAGSAAGASDPSNFAAFLRYAFRSGLNDESTSSNLGFRCAMSVAVQ